MRLSIDEISKIKQVVLAFDPTAKVYLYGSRTDDTQRGGDIDLMVISEKINFEDKIKIKLKLYDAIGEQKIDLSIQPNCDEPFTQLAINQGILL